MSPQWARREWSGLVRSYGPDAALAWVEDYHKHHVYDDDEYSEMIAAMYEEACSA